MALDIEKIIREYIDKSIHMSLATCKLNKPWVCEVHFVYDHDLNLYYRSLKSRRHSLEIEDNPNVSGNIVKQHNIDEVAHGIYFEGKAELIKDPKEMIRIFQLFKSRLGATEDILNEAKREDGHQFYKITVSKWYAFGKFGLPDSLKYELTWNGGAK